MKKITALLFAALVLFFGTISHSAAHPGWEKKWVTPLGTFRLVSNFGFCDTRVREMTKEESKELDDFSKKYKVPPILHRCDVLCAPIGGCSKLPVHVNFNVTVEKGKVFLHFHFRTGKKQVKHIIVQYLKGGELKDVTPTTKPATRPNKSRR